MALTQSQMIAAVADRAEMSRADAKRALGALDEIVLEELGNAQKIRIGGLVQLTVRVKPAQKNARGATPRRARRSTLPLNQRASMSVREHWRKPRRRFPRYRRHGGGSRRKTASATGKGARNPTPGWTARQRQPAARPLPAGGHPAGAARRAADRGDVRHRRQRDPQRLGAGQGDRQGAAGHDLREHEPRSGRDRADGPPTPRRTPTRTAGAARRSTPATSSTRSPTASISCSASCRTACR